MLANSFHLITVQQTETYEKSCIWLQDYEPLIKAGKMSVRAFRYMVIGTQSEEVASKVFHSVWWFCDGDAGRMVTMVFSDGRRNVGGLHGLGYGAGIAVSKWANELYIILIIFNRSGILLYSFYNYVVMLSTKPIQTLNGSTSLVALFVGCFLLSPNIQAILHQNIIPFRILII